jgi:hypothetical protein
MGDLSAQKLPDRVQWCCAVRFLLGAFIHSLNRWEAPSQPRRRHCLEGTVKEASRKRQRSAASLSTAYDGTVVPYSSPQAPARIMHKGIIALIIHTMSEVQRWIAP